MDSKKVLKFDLEPSQVRIKDLLNKQFLDISIDAISSIYPNRNRSHFTIESLNNAVPSVKNKPVLGAFGKGKLNGPNDFDEHNAEIHYDGELEQAYWDYENGERILGTVRESDYVGVEEKEGHTWLTFRCCLWTLYNYKAVKSLLKSKRKRVSVEVMVNKSYIDDNGIEIIEDFELLGVTILGDKTLEGIPGAHLTILEKLENTLFKKNVECLQFAYKSLEESEVELKGSNLDFESNLHINDNKPMEKGGDAMLTAEQKRGLLEAAVSEIFNESDDCCWAYVCDYTDTDVYICVDGGEYYRYPYSISEENEVSFNKENGTRVLRDWKEFSAETDMGCEKNMDEEQPSSDGSDDENNDEKPNEEDEACKTQAKEDCSIEENSQEAQNEEYISERDEKNEEDYPVEIDGKSYSVEELKEAYIEMTNNYKAVQIQIEELNEQIARQESEKMYSKACEMFDEEDFEESEQSQVEAMKAQVKEKCDSKTFSNMEECIEFTEDVIAKYLYKKIKANKSNKLNKSNEGKDNFSVNMTNTRSENTKKSPSDILKNYVNK